MDATDFLRSSYQKIKEIKLGVKHYGIFTLCIFFLSLWIMSLIASWFDMNRLVIQSPIKSLQYPVVIEKRATGSAFLKDLIPQKAYGAEVDDIKPSKSWPEVVVSAKRIAKIYNFPANVLIAQAAHESLYGTSEFAVQRNNYLGLNARDDCPECAWYFENVEQCFIKYMEVIQSEFPLAWSLRDDPLKLLTALIYNPDKKKYATDPVYINSVTSLPEWRIY